MPLFDVEIKATVRKTYQVEADNADLAEEEAHQIFSVLCDDVDEDYDQETLNVIELVKADDVPSLRNIQYDFDGNAIEVPWYDFNGNRIA